MMTMTLGIYKDYERELNRLLFIVALFTVLADRHDQFKTAKVTGLTKYSL